YLGEKALLVDAPYVRFGAPHRSFTILTDAEMCGVYLSSLESLEQKRIAAKLAPRIASVQLNLCIGLMWAERWTEVQAILPVLTRLDRNGSMWRSVQASIARQHGEYYRAARILREAIAINSEETSLFRDLGDMYAAIGNFADARSMYQMGLTKPHSEEQGRGMKESIQRIDANAGNAGTNAISRLKN